MSGDSSLYADIGNLRLRARSFPEGGPGGGLTAGAGSRLGGLTRNALDGGDVVLATGGANHIAVRKC